MQTIDTNSDASNNDTELWVSSLAGGQASLVVPGELWPSSPVWSPDGRTIAFEGAYRGDGIGSALYLVGADGSGPHVLTSRPGAGTGGVSWSPDGRYLAYDGVADGTPEGFPPDGHTDIFVIGADGSEERNITNNADIEWGSPAWSPDGSRMAYISGPNKFDRHLTVVPVDGATPIGALAIGPLAQTFVWSPDATRIASIWQGIISSVAIDLQDPPATLLDTYRGDTFSCGLSWQRLDP